MSRLSAAMLVVGLLVGPPATSTAGESRFTIVDSSPTSWVAQGLSDYTIIADPAYWPMTAQWYEPKTAIRFRAEHHNPSDNAYWEVIFGAGDGTPLKPGLYPNFQRVGVQSPGQPALSFSGSGHLDNQAAGSFEILEAVYGPDGVMQAFAANFTHYGETDPANWAIVEIRYNATVPEPASWLVATLAGLGLVVMRSRGLRSAGCRPQ